MDELEKIKILLIEDEGNDCKAIKEYIDTIDRIELVGMTDDSDKGFMLTIETRPNIVILDLELTYGFGSGFRYLSLLNNSGASNRPFILVTTQINSKQTWERAREYGADFILYKRQRGYSPEFVIDTVEQLFVAFPTERCFVPDTAKLSQTPDEIEKRIRLRISDEFFKIGLLSNLRGRNYLEDTIYILITKKDDDKKSFRQLIFPSLVKKYDKSIANLNRGMMTAIENTWHKGDIEILAKHYKARINPDTAVPTVSEFVYYYAEKIKKELI